MGKTYRRNAHEPLKRIQDRQNKNNARGTFKGDWLQDKHIGIESYAHQKAKQDIQLLEILDVLESSASKEDLNDDKNFMN